MSDYQADWERKRKPCEKCQGYGADSLGKMRCWRYKEVQAAGGITLDTRHPQVLRKKGGTWKGTYKTYWPFDYEPVLILGGCPVLLPKGPYCQVCADILHLDEPNPVVKCSVCGRDGNACDNCGGVFEPEDFTWCGPRDYRLQLCKVCHQMLEEAAWGGICRSCGQHHERTRTVEVFYPWPTEDEYWRLCPACGELLAAVLHEGREEHQAGNDDEILCANCEDYYPPDVMTEVERDFWLCETCKEEYDYEGRELEAEPQEEEQEDRRFAWCTACQGQFLEEEMTVHIHSEDGTEHYLCPQCLEKAGSKEETPEPESHPCQGCEFKKGMGNKAKGKRLGYPPGGKCTRPEGFCEKYHGISETHEAAA